MYNPSTNNEWIRGTRNRGTHACKRGMFASQYIGSYMQCNDLNYGPEIMSVQNAVMHYIVFKLRAVADIFTVPSGTDR